MKLINYFTLLGTLIGTYSVNAVTYNIKNNTNQPLGVSMHTTAGIGGASCATHHRNQTPQGAWVPISPGELANPAITPGAGCIGSYIYYNSPTPAKYYLQFPFSSSTITINYGNVPGRSEPIWSITENTTDGKYNITTPCYSVSNDCNSLP